MVFCAFSAQAAPINEVDYNTITVGQIIDFEGLAGSGGAGTNYDAVLNFGGVQIGERFAGQVLGFSGNSDTLSGSPDSPLSVVAGAPGQNLAILVNTGSNRLAGLGFLGHPNFDAVGEGAVAILFDNDQSEFGFQSVGGNAGGAVFDFFRRDGSLIATLTPANLGVDLFGFSREGGANDIAGISIYNTDPAGIAFDNLIFDVPGAGTTPVPAPAALWLMLGGLGALAAAGRRRQTLARG